MRQLLEVQPASALQLPSLLAGGLPTCLREHPLHLLRQEASGALAAGVAGPAVLHGIEAADELQGTIQGGDLQREMQQEARSPIIKCLRVRAAGSWCRLGLSDACMHLSSRRPTALMQR